MAETKIHPALKFQVDTGEKAKKPSRRARKRARLAAKRGLISEGAMKKHMGPY